jgi:hypothetical protein
VSAGLLLVDKLGENSNQIKRSIRRVFYLEVISMDINGIELINLFKKNFLGTEFDEI